MNRVVNKNDISKNVDKNNKSNNGVINMNKLKIALIFLLSFFVKNSVCVDSKVIFLNLTDKTATTRISYDDKDKDSLIVGESREVLPYDYLERSLRDEFDNVEISFCEELIGSRQTAWKGAQYKIIGGSFSKIKQEDLEGVNKDILVVIFDVSEYKKPLGNGTKKEDSFKEKSSKYLQQLGTKALDAFVKTNLDLYYLNKLEKRDDLVEFILCDKDKEDIFRGVRFIVGKDNKNNLNFVIENIKLINKLKDLFNKIKFSTIEEAFKNSDLYKKQNWFSSFKNFTGLMKSDEFTQYLKSEFKTVIDNNKKIAQIDSNLIRNINKLVENLIKELYSKKIEFIINSCEKIGLTDKGKKDFAIKLFNPFKNELEKDLDKYNKVLKTSYFKQKILGSSMGVSQVFVEDQKKEDAKEKEQKLTKEESKEKENLEKLMLEGNIEGHELKEETREKYKELVEKEGGQTSKEKPVVKPLSPKKEEVKELEEQVIIKITDESVKKEEAPKKEGEELGDAPDLGDFGKKDAPVEKEKKVEESEEKKIIKELVKPEENSKEVIAELKKYIGVKDGWQKLLDDKYLGSIEKKSKNIIIGQTDYAAKRNKLIPGSWEEFKQGFLHPIRIELLRIKSGQSSDFTKEKLVEFVNILYENISIYLTEELIAKSSNGAPHDFIDYKFDIRKIFKDLVFEKQKPKLVKKESFESISIEDELKNKIKQRTELGTGVIDRKPVVKKQEFDNIEKEKLKVLMEKKRQEINPEEIKMEDILHRVQKEKEKFKKMGTKEGDLPQLKEKNPLLETMSDWPEESQEKK